jgi:arylsulfatase A-like enzyme
MLRAGLVLLLGALASATGALWRRVATPNVALIILDTLRADRLGGYGCSEARTPTLDRLARRGVLFAEAIAQSSWTKPSVASILTSLYPAAHQALAGRGIDEGTPLSIDSLNDELLTLPEALGSLGFRTGCIQTNPNIKREYGFGQGCSEYEYMARNKRASEVSAKALNWLERGAREPFFLYAHYVDPHMPYTPPRPFVQLFTQAGHKKPRVAWNVETYRSMYSNLLDSNLGLAPYQPALVPSPQQLRHWKGLYDGEVAALDEGLGVLLDAVLKKEHTWIFVVADHGEQHLEHGSVGHGQALYEELVRVPLIVAGPGVTPGRIVEEPVELIDLFPTVLDLIGEASGSRNLQGRSLSGLLTGRRSGAVQPSPVYSEVEDAHAVRTRTIRMVRRGAWKLIVNEFRGDQELYDLTRDPGEQHPILDPRAQMMPELVRELQRRRSVDEQRAAQLPTPERVQLDAETLRELKSLNYIQ